MATLSELEKPETYKQLYKISEKLTSGINDAITDTDVEAILMGEPPMSLPIFTDRDEILNAREASRDYPHSRRSQIFRMELLKRGVHARGIWFVSLSHSDEDIDKTLEAVHAAFKETKKVVF